MASELKMLKQKEENETARLKNVLKQELKRVEQDTLYQEQNSDLEIKRLNQDKALELERKKKEHEIALTEQKNSH